MRESCYLSNEESYDTQPENKYRFPPTSCPDDSDMNYSNDFLTRHDQVSEPFWFHSPACRPYIASSQVHVTDALVASEPQHSSIRQPPSLSFFNLHETSVHPSISSNGNTSDDPNLNSNYDTIGCNSYDTLRLTPQGLPSVNDDAYALPTDNSSHSDYSYSVSPVLRFPTPDLPPFEESFLTCTKRPLPWQFIDPNIPSKASGLAASRSMVGKEESGEAEESHKTVFSRTEQLVDSASDTASLIRVYLTGTRDAVERVKAGLTSTCPLDRYYSLIVSYILFILYYLDVQILFPF
ncbi:unnamed protein product [Protopolystoma xenopodis]|uniref:Uncharacterized protein n=1 Tax=Protopolystoma xenopodis TaxID=117903 RepID=A0A3S5APC8_9PLAT|nr:unnamed protein product [Protopolystoma xenopodis]